MLSSEFEIIEHFFKNATGSNSSVICGIGDDAAIISPPVGHHLAISTDTLISGVHFFSDTEPYDVGYKSLAVNVSDMAAMAAEPLWVTLSLTLPDSNRGWVERFTAGFLELATKFNINLIGGDLSHGPLSITVQIIGKVPDGAALTRSGAKPGDGIYVTDCLGGAGLALAVLGGEIQHFPQVPEACMARLNRPVPRIKAGIAIRSMATSAIDISDGLIGDLQHILDSSSVGAEIKLARIPVCPELNDLSDEMKWKFCLGVGDDYELCFTMPDMYADSVIDIEYKSECSVTKIGKITEGKKLEWFSLDGKPYTVSRTGYRHF